MVGSLGARIFRVNTVGLGVLIFRLDTVGSLGVRIFRVDSVGSLGVRIFRVDTVIFIPIESITPSQLNYNNIFTLLTPQMCIII